MKVFLSVSGESYAPFVNLIYSKLKDAGLEVVRYEGGSYSPQPMLGCDYVFMIPPFSEGAEFFVGKGQHEELRHLNAKSMWNKTYMLTTHNQKAAVNSPSAVTLVGRNITSNNALAGSTDWKKGFAKVTTSNAISLHLIIDKIVDAAEMKLERETPFGDPIEGGVEILHDKSGSLVAKMPNPNYKGLPFEEMKKLLIPLS